MSVCLVTQYFSLHAPSETKKELMSKSKGLKSYDELSLFALCAEQVCVSGRTSSSCYSLKYCLEETNTLFTSQRASGTGIALHNIVAMAYTLPMYADIEAQGNSQNMPTLRRRRTISHPPKQHVEPTSILYDEEAAVLRTRPIVELTYRPRILALHGAQSNNSVTTLQLSNLQITDDDFDIDYLQGGVEVDEAHSSLDGLIQGPFYSWFDKEDSASVIRAVMDVVNYCRMHGPFDGIYGFSSGAVVASLVNNLSRDTELRNLVQFLNRNADLHGQYSQRNIFSSLRFRSNHAHQPINLQQPLFKFAILACAAPDISPIREIIGCSHIELGSIPLPSFHIIGIEDNFKSISEENALLYAAREIRYLPGGHGVPRDVSLDKDLCTALRGFARTLGKSRRWRREPDLEYVQMNKVSSIHLLKESQVALVKLKHQLLPEGIFRGGATIRGALAAQPAERPFLYTSRNTDVRETTTYGDLLSFIDGGAGDLRALDIKPGEVVAYVAPPGGSAMAAVAFLSIGAQTAAAPLAPGTAEPDALDTLDQFDAKHLILFDGVECPGVEAAFEKYAATGKAKIHRAYAIGSVKPGLFTYRLGLSTATDYSGKRPLVNAEDGTCLLLRTSGTTARPKGVPLTQCDLITNGAIIAHAMQLTPSDVCYSIMPLFHIGGISASILCTMTSGGAVSCDPDPFDPSRMVDALGLSNPQPTWYSSVPTIHNSTVSFLKNIASRDEKYNRMGVGTNGVWATGHSLRMIRSGAAALLRADGDALVAAYGNVPVYATYSMSEQMPISQPPARWRDDSFLSKPGSVGVPVAASTAIISRRNFRPQPPGVEGEIAISGPTVMKNYLNNPEADQKSFFYLSIAENRNLRKNQLPYFLTGDIGVMDSDGHLTLKGRAKELIKKGGEQVSPFEIEELLKTHPWIETPICFAVPSKLYGEEVGCALVLSPSSPVGKSQSLGTSLHRKQHLSSTQHTHETQGQDTDAETTLKLVSAEMRECLKAAKLAPIKWPTKWIIVNDDQLPKTKTKKYIRVNLSTHLGLDPKEEEIDASKPSTKAQVDWEVIGAFRFVLACYVMFMHIGSNESWGPFNNLRGWPWHVHVFFTLGGYSMASPMNPAIQKKFSYFMARIGSMYPMYAVALSFGLLNLIIVCRPSTFRSDFHWEAQPDDLYLEDGSLAPLFCEGTPATPNSYWGSLFLTVFTYIFGLAITPFWPITWWLGYYLWFSSMYYCCLACFPVTYNYFYHKTRKKVRLLLIWLIGLLLVNAALCTGAWFVWKDMEDYGNYDEEGNPTVGVGQNVGVLSFYLFGPIWQIYFVIGIATAFLYDAHRPAEKHSVRRWGRIADLITLLMFGMSVAIVMQGVQPDDGEMYMRPDSSNQKTDSASSNRLWDNIGGRIFAPLTTLWIYALSTGEGFTAKILRWSYLSKDLAPNAYNCFLFHQMVGQWYYAATRNGTMWNWWRFRKDFYWFSPAPCPVEWYEYFYLVGLIVSFSRLMNMIEPFASERLSKIKEIFVPAERNDDDTATLLAELIEGMTGIEPLMEYTLGECGLASIGVPVLVNLLNKNFLTKERQFNITASDLVGAKTIGDMVEVVDAIKALAEEQGV